MMKLNAPDLQVSYCGSRGFAKWIYVTPRAFDDVLSPNYFGRGGQSNPLLWDRIEIIAEFKSNEPEIGEVIVTLSEPGYVEVKTLWRKRVGAEAGDHTKGQAKMTRIISAIGGLDPTDEASFEADGRPRLGALQQVVGPISAGERDKAWSLYKAAQPPAPVPRSPAEGESAVPKTKAA